MTELTEKQEEFIQEYIKKKNDVAVFNTVLGVSYQPLGKDKKFKSKAFVVSNYRLHFFDLDKGKLNFSKDYHILDLKEMKLEGTDLIVSFEDLDPKVKKEDLFIVHPNGTQLNKVVRSIRECHQRVTFGWPSRLCYKTINLDSCLEDLLPPKVSSPHGLKETYLAVCNKRGTPKSKEFIRIVKDLYAVRDHHLVLSDLLNIDPTVDITAIIFALQNNTYFRSIEFKDLPIKEAGEFFYWILRKNRTLSRIVYSNMNVELPEKIGIALIDNPWHRIQILDFSGSKLRDASSFSDAILRMPHSMKAINLAGSFSSTKDIHKFLAALYGNLGLSLGIVSLNIANNKLDSEGIQLLGNWFRDFYDHYALRNLCISNTGMTFIEPCSISYLDGLEYLDISENPVSDKIHTLFDSELSRIKTVKIRGCNYPLEALQKLLNIVSRSTRDISLDMGVVDFPAKNFNVIIDTLTQTKVSSSLSGLVALNLAEISIKINNLKELIKALPSTLQKLWLDSNLTANVTTEECVGILGKTINMKLTQLQFLSLQGNKEKSSTWRAKTFIVPLFECLKQNTTIKYLDVSYHGFSDAGFTALCYALRKNKSITYLSTDGNGVTMNGYLIFLQLLNRNKTLCSFKFPYEDSKDPLLSPLLYKIAATLSARTNPEAHELEDPFDYAALQPKVAVKGPPPPPLPVPAVFRDLASRYGACTTSTKPTEEDRPLDSSTEDDPSTKNAETGTSGKKKKKSKSQFFQAKITIKSDAESSSSPVLPEHKESETSKSSSSKKKPFTVPSKLQQRSSSAFFTEKSRSQPAEAQTERTNLHSGDEKIEEEENKTAPCSENPIEEMKGEHSPEDSKPEDQEQKQDQPTTQNADTKTETPEISDDEPPNDLPPDPDALPDAKPLEIHFSVFEIYEVVEFPTLIEFLTFQDNK